MVVKIPEKLGPLGNITKWYWAVVFKQEICPVLVVRFWEQRQGGELGHRTILIGLHGPQKDWSFAPDSPDPGSRLDTMASVMLLRKI
jgi:hypothetical protein